MNEHGTWHVDRELMDRYAAGTLPLPAASSLEAHLVDCGPCRSLAPAAPDRHERMWTGIVDRVDAPRPLPVERLLRALGVGGATARLLAVTPSLTLAWLGAVALVLGFSVAAAHGAPGDAGLALFLVVAPVVPVAGVAAAFGRTFDPAHEITTATPMSGLRLLLVRSVAVVLASTILAGPAALALPHHGWVPAAWLLPALALTVATLALATAISPGRALALVAGSWLVVCASAFAVAARRLTALPALGDHYVGLDPVGQAALVALAAGGAIVFLLRRDTLGRIA